MREFQRLMLSILAASTNTSNIATSPPPLASSNAVQPLAANPPPPLAYHVHRTASHQLPIYHLAKRGGNLHQTRIRKIEGNVEVLRNEIESSLGLREGLVFINRLTGHIIIKVRQDMNCKPCIQTKIASWRCGNPGIAADRIGTVQGWYRDRIKKFLEDRRL